MKQRKCKACKTPFTPARSTQTACGIDCAMQLAHEKKVKLAECDRLDTVRKDRVRKERLKTRRDWEKEAQTAFNAFIRARFGASWGAEPIDVDGLREPAQINAVTRALKDWCRRAGIPHDHGRD